jgi:hypothetical protein
MGLKNFGFENSLRHEMRLCAPDVVRRFSSPFAKQPDMRRVVCPPGQSLATPHMTITLGCELWDKPYVF